MRHKHIAVSSILSYVQGVLSLNLLLFLFTREGCRWLPKRWMAMSKLWFHHVAFGLEKALRKGFQCYCRKACLWPEKYSYLFMSQIQEKGGMLRGCGGDNVRGHAAHTWIHLFHLHHASHPFLALDRNILSLSMELLLTMYQGIHLGIPLPTKHLSSLVHGDTYDAGFDSGPNP